MADKHKFSAFVSPLGEARYAWIDKPDPYQQELGKEQFKCRVLMEDTPEVRAWVQKVFEAGVAEAKKAGVKLKKAAKSPFTFPEDLDEDDFIPAEGKDKAKYDETYKNSIFFEAKTGFKPATIDAKKNELPDDVRIMPGDKVKVKVVLNPYEGFGSGISLRLSVVQLIEKNTSYSKGKANLDGFDEEEGYDSEGQTSGSSEDDDDIPF